MTRRFKITDFCREDQEKINRLRNECKFVYHLRGHDEGEGFNVESRAFVNRIGFLPNSWKKMLHREKMTIVNYPQYEKLKEMYPNGEYKNVEW